MRFVIYGAGAVGGTIGARLFQHGHEVLLIARGAHHDAIKATGLTFVTPIESVTLPIPVVSHPSEIAFSPDDVVILTMKSQHTWDALLSLRAAAGTDVPVICCQNGVANERMAIRLFERVYGMVVMLPANHFEAGVVECNSTSKSGILDTGCYPKGKDALITAVAKAIDGSNCSSFADEDVMRWKYQKLLRNLNNSLQALCEMNEATLPISSMLHAEALSVYEAAGINSAGDEEEKERRGDFVTMKPIGGKRRAGGSSWQSLMNGKGDIESDYMNGEIVLLGRMNGAATPANTVLQNLATQAARENWEPGRMQAQTIMSQIEERRD
ncbi:MAG: ketopantoate reductase family protein [Pseudomonadales bacterium]|jgi:2-dehydropantoate 2-reductase|tara:strand:- start:2717 stop:3694 length:978 start_codon:yes stop_codon:yes gene_type:complete